ncbi:hypothetical protein EVAR_37454_1 [Eumeta japonica]|uniref:Uncharacterized protein n=1 Tax=Eumeta variegata TaxID=151549 RepID=A0A4C1X446_EUMVA|nr:hypothetical protein EVAR_37454_1 [Eumeta japonica]
MAQCGLGLLTTCATNVMRMPGHDGITRPTRHRVATASCQDCRFIENWFGAALLDLLVNFSADKASVCFNKNERHSALMPECRRSTGATAGGAGCGEANGGFPLPTNYNFFFDRVQINLSQQKRRRHKRRAGAGARKFGSFHTYRAYNAKPGI